MPIKNRLKNLIIINTNNLLLILVAGFLNAQNTPQQLVEKWVAVLI